MPATGITVLKHNAPWGPFTRAQIEDGLRRGDFTLSYLAHAPGLTEWLPLGEVLHWIESAAPPPPLPIKRDLPPAPAASPIPMAKVLPPPLLPPVPPKEKPPVLAQAAVLPASPVAPPVARESGPALETAPFLLRTMAFLLDCAVLFIPVLILFGLGALTVQIQGWWQHAKPQAMLEEWGLLDRNFHQLLILVATALGWLYAACMECSPRQATLGKTWMGLKVTDAQGHRLGFLRATGRFAAKYLSALPCFLGFALALFGSRGMALHDYLATTRVVRA